MQEIYICSISVSQLVDWGPLAGHQANPQAS
jgi:hypothetical protein